MRQTDSSAASVVVKVGGSLFDLSDLASRLRRWLDELPIRKVLLIPGGGHMADAVRDLDRRHHLGDEVAHWLALRVLTIHADFLAALLPGAVVVKHPCECQACWQRGELAVLDAHAFALADEGQAGCLPHSWSVTSDSLAARAAQVLGARRLLLLKSMSLPQDITWSEAGQRGIVDSFFAQVVGEELEVRVINFREGPS